MYVLLIITHIYYGSVVTMQEFSTLETCALAKETIVAHARKINGDVYANCAIK